MYKLTLAPISSLIIPTKFKSIHLSVQEQKLKEEFQDGRHSSYLGFMLATILAILDLVVGLIFLLSFKLICLWGQEENFKANFQDGHHLGFFDWNLFLAKFDQQVQEKFKTDFRIGMILATFDLQSALKLNTSFKSIHLSVQERLKIDFQDGEHSGHLDFWIRTIFAILDLQVS